MKKPTIIMTSKGKIHLYLLSLAIITASLILVSVVYNIGMAKKPSITVILDPGHGGIYTGLTDKRYFSEKDITLQLAWKLREELEEMNIKVEMTRETDSALDNESTGEDMEARLEKFNSGKYGLFTSLHLIRSTSNNDMGCMVLYPERNKSSSLLADNIQNKLNRHFKKTWGRKLVREPVGSGYRLLDKANIPGVLIEAGFISNTSEKRLLKDPSYQKKLAQAIAQGIREYLKSPGKPSSGSGSGKEPSEDKTPFSTETDSRLVRK